MSGFLLLLAVAAAGTSMDDAPSTPVALPAPSENPLNRGETEDPILALAEYRVPPDSFASLIRDAVMRHPARIEAGAKVAEAEEARKEALAGKFPTIDIVAQSGRSITRNFGGNDPEDIIERTRGVGRTDAVMSVEETLFDFGATNRRIAAASARVRATNAEAEASADEVALNAIVAWYDVFGYQAMVDLSESFLESLLELRSAMESRIEQGVSAPGDLPRVESYIASAQSSLAGYRRRRANAEARYAEIFGGPPPGRLARAPFVGAPAVSKDMAQQLAAQLPAVKRAEALAAASRQDARAARAATWPTLSVAVDAGKYGFLDEDYDVRGRIVLRHRLSGGLFARAEQARARSASVEAAALVTRNQAEREAAIAWSDVAALEQQLDAYESSYRASRNSRDVLATRFIASKGTLFDLLEAESGFFGVAANYVQGLIELDEARYALLSRTGRLVPTLGIEIGKVKLP